MSELKPCPFCNKPPFEWTTENLLIEGSRKLDGLSCYCSDQLNNRSPENWNTRPTEEVLKARIAVLEKAIRSTLDYIDGEHSGSCDKYGICSNCSIRFELCTIIMTDEQIKQAR